VKVKPDLTWLIDWDGESYWLEPNTELTVVAICPDIGCAGIRFPNPEPIGEPRVIEAVVPIKALLFNTEE
jgi:hypothetical protein